MKTIKVRVALAITPTGKWVANGWSDGDEEEMIQTCLEYMDGKEQIVWLEAEVPIPDVPVIKAEVANEGND
jgi:hypothetical protein